MMACSPPPPPPVITVARSSKLQHLLGHLYNCLPADIRVRGVEIDADIVVMEAIEYIGALEKKAEAQENASPKEPRNRSLAAFPTATPARPAPFSIRLETGQTVSLSPASGISSRSTPAPTIKIDTTSATRVHVPPLTQRPTPAKISAPPKTSTSGSISLLRRRSEQQRTLTSTSASSDSSVVTCDDARRDYVGEGGKEIWEEGSHGLACIPRCSCPLSNDAVPLKPAYKTAVYAYLRKAVVAPPTAADDVEPRLHKRRFQDQLFELITSSLRRKDMHAFLKLFRPNNEVKRAADGNCAVYKHSSRNADGVSQGVVSLWGETFSIQKVLFALYRDEGAGVPIEELSIIARKECKASRLKDNSRFLDTFCLNPWHFEPVGVAPLTNGLDHECDNRLAFARKTNAVLMCDTCHAKKATIRGFKSSLPATVGEQVNPDDGDSIEDLEKELEAEMDPDQTFSQQEEAKVEGDPFGSLKIDEGDVENDLADSLPAIDNDTSALTPGDSDWRPRTKKGSLSREEIPTEALKRPARSSKFRCWKCFQWYSNSDLAGHNCLPSHTATRSYFCCHYCGSRHDDKATGSSHVSKCKVSGMNAVPTLVERSEENAQQERAKRRKRQASDDLLCSKCNVTFADAAELSKHASKAKCRSVECNVCGKIFATAYSHQHHDCERQTDETSGGNVDGMVLVKVPQVGGMPVKCKQCGLEFESGWMLDRHSKLSALTCRTCAVEFRDHCTILRHRCTGSETATRSFKCSRCDLRVPTSTQLDAHLKTCSPWIG